MLHLTTLEREFRTRQQEVLNEEAIRSYYNADGGEMAVKLSKINLGILMWEHRDLARQRLGVNSKGSLQDQIDREWRLLRMVEEEDKLFLARERLSNLIMDLSGQGGNAEKAQFFHALAEVGLEPVVVCNQTREGNNDVNWQVLVLLPGVEQLVRTRKVKKKVLIAEAKTEFVKKLVIKFKDYDRSMVDEWIVNQIGMKAKWGNSGSYQDGDQVVWADCPFVPETVINLDDEWVVCAGNRRKTGEKLSRDQECWKEKSERQAEIMLLVNSCHSEIASELWTISEDIWFEVQEVVVRRWRELLSVTPLVAVDFEGDGCVGQFSMANTMCISSFVFLQGFFPRCLTKMFLETCPVIVGDRADLAKYLGGYGGCMSLDPFVLLRDVPGMGTGHGISDLAEVFLGIQVKRLKMIGSLCQRKQFELLSMDELKYGWVRCSDWYGRSLTVEQSLYAAFDAEVLIRSLIIGMWLETTLRRFSGLEEETKIKDVLGWWDWAKNLTASKSLLQRAEATTSGKTVKLDKMVLDGENHFVSHERGKKLSNYEEVGGDNQSNLDTVINLGAERRRTALVDLKGVSKSVDWKRRDSSRKNYLTKRESSEKK